MDGILEMVAHTTTKNVWIKYMMKIEINYILKKTSDFKEKLMESN